MKRELVTRLQVCYQVAQRRACEVTTFARSSIRYRSVADPQHELRMRLKELAAVRVGWGYRRLHILLRRERWEVSAKRVYRLYVEEGLGLRRKPPRRRVACMKRQARPSAEAPNECWSMDFMSDELYDGRRLKILTLVDNHTRESLAIRVGQRIRGLDVAQTLEGVVSHYGRPEAIRVDNGPECISKELDLWAYANGVKLDFSRPGKPTDNAMIESFNARLRQECLNEHWFLSLEDAQEKIDAWRADYNQLRPHSSLGNQTPAQFAKGGRPPAVARLQPPAWRQEP